MLLQKSLQKLHRKQWETTVSFLQIVVNVSTPVWWGETPQTRRDAVNHKHDRSEPSLEQKSKKCERLLSPGGDACSQSWSVNKSRLGILYNKAQRHRYRFTGSRRQKKRCTTAGGDAPLQLRGSYHRSLISVNAVVSTLYILRAFGSRCCWQGNTWVTDSGYVSI